MDAKTAAKPVATATQQTAAPTAATGTKDDKKGAAMKAPPKKDTRLFLRIPATHEWRKLSPAFFRSSLTKTAQTAESAVRNITRTRTGFAITAVTEGARAALLHGAHHLSGVKLEESCTWHSNMAPNVPDVLMSAEGPVKVTANMVVDETACACGVRPVAARSLKKRSASSGTTWVLHFSATPRPWELACSRRPAAFECGSPVC